MSKLMRKAGRVDYVYRMPLHMDADVLGEYADIVEDLITRGADQDFVPMPVAVIDVAMQAIGGDIKRRVFDDLNGLMRTDMLDYDEFVASVQADS